MYIYFCTTFVLVLVLKAGAIGECGGEDGRECGGGDVGEDGSEGRD